MRKRRGPVFRAAAVAVLVRRRRARPHRDPEPGREARCLSGIFVDPYYTASFAFGRPYRGELGTYLELPICLHDDDGCYEGGSGGHHWSSHVDLD